MTLPSISKGMGQQLFLGTGKILFHEVTTIHEPSSYANTTGLTFFRNTKLLAHGYEQSSAHFLHTHCPDS